MKGEMVDAVDLAESVPWLLRVPPGPSVGSFKDVMLALGRLQCQARARCVEFVAEFHRRGLPCEYKLGVRDILVLSPEPEPFLTPRFL
jgi:hypothetical protein